jgi:hypothetical protein
VKNHPPIILRLGPHEYAVAVWRDDEEGEPVYEIIHRDIRDVSISDDTRMCSHDG